MDDPGLAWPFWKFGLKQDDLVTKLHDEYNTFPSSIQDPEAFHHDVFEISHEASSTDEFYRLLRDRKQQRLRELNDSLESASLEIIANPSLIGTEQWQHALQLFRTKSLDSLVRYFSSYLPDNHPWRTTPYRSSSDTASSVDSRPSFFDDEHDDGPYMTEEPIPLSESISLKAHLPASPRSMTMCSDSSAASPMDHHSYLFDNLTPARSLSFSESEPEHLSQDMVSHDEETSQPCDEESLSVSVLGFSHSIVLEASRDVQATSMVDEDDDASLGKSEGNDSETPTPRPLAAGTSFFDSKPSLPRRQHRSISPSRPHPLSHIYDACHHDVRHIVARRDGSRQPNRRRNLGLLVSRVTKALPDASRPRPRGRGRMRAEG